MKTIGVVGGGIMGSGIAQVAAQSGCQVLLMEVSEKLCQKAIKRIETNLDRAIQKGKLKKSQKPKILKRLSTTSNFSDLKKATLVIEAVPEKAPLKKKVFRQLDLTLSSKTLLASNTSSISISELASVTKRAPKVIGMHFMNPVPVMPLVEIVLGKKTSKATLQTIKQLAKKMGKTAVLSKDKPGFITNRILAPMLNEAIICLMEKIGTKEDIDTVMKLGMHHPMGPLELADFIGLDTLHEIMQVLHKGFKNNKYRPAKLLTQMVRSGKCGRKTGIGFYRYNKVEQK